MTKKKGGLAPEIDIVLPFIKKKLPLVAIFRLLGIDKISEIPNYILYKGEEEKDYRLAHLLKSVMKSTEIASMDKETLHAWIGSDGNVLQKSQGTHIPHVVSNELFPHMGLDLSPETCFAKAVYLGYCIRKLLLVYLEKSEK